MESRGGITLMQLQDNEIRQLGHGAVLLAITNALLLWALYGRVDSYGHWLTIIGSHRLYPIP